MKTLVRLALLVVILGTFSTTVRAQDTTKLVPFTSEAFQIQGVVPDGWKDSGDGLYTRQKQSGDVTLLAMQSAPLKVDAVLKAILPQLLLKEAPKSVGEYKSPTFTWTLYQVDVTTQGITVRVDLALTEKDGKTYIVLLQTVPDEYATLHKNVFIPVLDALAPLKASAEESLPYKVEEVTFKNGDVTLAGTLTLPPTSGKHPAIVMITGSGPQDRDEVVAGFAVFRGIADYVTRQGVAVLRFDDRGVGKSTGSFEGALSTDFASDAKAAVAYLKTRDDINLDQVGAFGHSEGGLIVALLAADPTSGIAFGISMAGTAVSGRDVLLRQNELILKASGASDTTIKLQLDFLSKAIELVKKHDWAGLDKLTHDTALQVWPLMTEAEKAETGAKDAESYAPILVKQVHETMGNDWFAFFLAYDPGKDWAKTRIPILALYGTLDLQVEAKQNAGPLETALKAAGNKDFTVVVLEKANHLFQEAKTGSPTEYSTLPKEFVKDFLPTIGNWLVKHVDVGTQPQTVATPEATAAATAQK